MKLKGCRYVVVIKDNVGDHKNYSLNQESNFLQNKLFIKHLLLIKINITSVIKRISLY